MIRCVGFSKMSSPVIREVLSSGRVNSEMISSLDIFVKPRRPTKKKRPMFGGSSEGVQVGAGVGGLGWVWGGRRAVRGGLG